MVNIDNVLDMNFGGGGGIGWQQTLGSAASFIEIIMLGTFIAAILLVLILGIRFLMRFKHTMFIKQLSGGKIVGRYHKYREYVDDDGVAMYQLLWTWKRYPAAPTESVIPTVKGRKHVEMYINEDGHYRYSRDPSSTIAQVLEKEGIQRGEEYEKRVRFWVGFPFLKREVSTTRWIPKGEKFLYGSDPTRSIAIEEPFGAEDRLIMGLQWRKAQELKKGEWWKNPTILGFAAIMIWFIIMAALMIFGWEDITKPSIEMAKTNVEMMKIQKEMVENMARYDENVQKLIGILPEEAAGGGGS